MKKNIFKLSTFILIIVSSSLSAQVDIDNAVELSGVDGTRVIKNLELPTNDNDAANKKYVDDQITASSGGGHIVGELYEGGIVVAVWKESGIEHGLIVSLTDLQTSGGSFTTAWSGNTSQMIGASAQSYTNGQQNTNAIIAQGGGGNTANRAATLCDAYTNPDTGTGVFSDWYLPAREELSLCTPLNNLFKLATHTGIFNPSDYWSSSEDNANYAWYMGFGTGSCDGSKTCGYRVRAVRRY